MTRFEFTVGGTRKESIFCCVLLSRQGTLRLMHPSTLNTQTIGLPWQMDLGLHQSIPHESRTRLLGREYKCLHMFFRQKNGRNGVKIIFKQCRISGFWVKLKKKELPSGNFKCRDDSAIYRSIFALSRVFAVKKSLTTTHRRLEFWFSFHPLPDSKSFRCVRAFNKAITRECPKRKLWSTRYLRKCFNILLDSSRPTTTYNHANLSARNGWKLSKVFQWSPVSWMLAC